MLCARAARGRWFSTWQARRSGQFTLALAPSTLKSHALDALAARRDALAQHNTRAPAAAPDDAAVVLASPAFAAWLEDEAFVSGLLSSLPLSTSSTVSTSTSTERTVSGVSGVSVLGAVVAAVAPSPDATPTPTPFAGLSVVYGHAATLLPGLWSTGAAKTVRPGSRGSVGSGRDRDAAVTVQVAPLDDTEDPLRVTLPLANTVFQNGRRSTLLASLWDGDGRRLRCTRVEPREHQLVVPPTADDAFSSVEAPLFPIAAPLTIASGLGNIVRQVQDPTDTHKTVPAARELEAAIPALLAARKRSNPGLEDAAMAVWALVVPAPLVPFYDALRQQTHALDGVALADNTPEAEHAAAADASELFTMLLAAGCRVHRVLSGGGGWGPKQGLLSLDPQMSHPAVAQDSSRTTTTSIENGNEHDSAADEAMLSFIRSFKNASFAGPPGTSEHGAASEAEVDGVAMPGAVLQFFVAPLAMADSGRNDAPAAPSAPSAPAARSIVLGAQAGSDGSLDGDVPDAGLQSDAPAVLVGHFGAVSNHGLFLAAASADPDTPVRTKLDVPQASVACVWTTDEYL